MKTYMVTLLLLLFEVNLNFGHALSKIELKNEAEIYEIKEDQSGLLITHPKDEATKLREIIYYHIIERPYDAQDLSQDKIEPDFENRFFTNSHSGNQFENKDRGDDEDGNTSEELNDDSSKETEDDSNSSESNEQNDSKQSTDENDLSKVEISDEDKSSSNRHGDNDSITKSDADDNEKSPIDADSMKIDIRFGDFINTTEERVAKVESTTDIVTAVPNTENKAISETPQSRSKREIKHTKTREGLNHADGKTLKREIGTYGMSLTGNRGVVWNDVKPPHIEYYVGEKETLTTSRPDVLVAEDITTTESAKEPVVIQEIDEDNQGDDHGGDDEEEEFIDTLAEIEKMLDTLLDKMDKTGRSESQQENQKDGDFENIRDENNRNDDDNDDSSLDPKEIEKSFIEILKVYKELTGGGTRNPTETDANDADITEDFFLGVSSNGNFFTPKEDDAKSIQLGAKLAPKRNDKDKETSNKDKDNDSKQQQLVKELLKNKYFWAWLKDASAAYLEILKRKFDAVIKTEVGNQIEQYFKEHKTEHCKESKEGQVDVVKEPVQTSNVTDDNVEGNTSDTTSSVDPNGLASNDTIAEYINESNETSSEISTKKHKDKPSDDKNTQSPVKIEAQNLFGSSVGSSKVTNIFIYNINKAFDLENIKLIKNDTNGVFVFGIHDKKPEQDKDDTPDKIPESIPEVETVEQDIISSKHNKTGDKVIDTDITQTSTAKPEAEKDHQSFEKDKDTDQVKDGGNVENSTDKSEVIPNDQTITEANDDETSTEINKEESAANTEKSVEAIKDDKEKEATTTEKVEPKEDLNDTESDKSKETAEVE